MNLRKQTRVLTVSTDPVRGTTNSEVSSQTHTTQKTWKWKYKGLFLFTLPLFPSYKDITLTENDETQGSRQVKY